MNSLDDINNLLKRLAPNWSDHVRMAIASLIYELEESKAPNGLVFSLEGKNGVKSYLISVKHESGYELIESVNSYQKFIREISEFRMSDQLSAIEIALNYDSMVETSRRILSGNNSNKGH